MLVLVAMVVMSAELAAIEIGRPQRQQLQPSSNFLN